MSPARPAATVSTHVLDTSAGRPAAGIAVEVSVRPGADAPWTAHAASATDADGRCRDLPALPEDTAHVRLRFGVEPYLVRTRRTDPADGGGAAAFFPEVAVVAAVTTGEHHHLPLLLSPFGYSVYRGS
ncbi:hydroxyisourate hydrolase [Actinacidiphila yeochonensis]|uniref:hydroxyisourate hydrolase n=1 Tax=Actinacidiphila yeochonensis TaxID=89050 RepID=UPI00055A386F|nr:hydroxyisourate hydrolase [Actinacidiphila yeochonensis]